MNRCIHKNNERTDGPGGRTDGRTPHPPHTHGQTGRTDGPGGRKDRAEGRSWRTDGRTITIGNKETITIGNTLWGPM